jgi:hypothetical protein
MALSFRQVMLFRNEVVPHSFPHPASNAGEQSNLLSTGHSRKAAFVGLPVLFHLKLRHHEAPAERGGGGIGVDISITAEQPKA